MLTAALRMVVCVCDINQTDLAAELTRAAASTSFFMPYGSCTCVMSGRADWGVPVLLSCFTTSPVPLLKGWGG